MFRLFVGALLSATVLLVAGRVVRADNLPAPTVVINELMWMGSSTSSADEWIELRNLTDEPIDLASWRLTKISGGAETSMVTIPTGKTIPANGYFLISNYAETSASSALAVTPDVVTTDVALSNSSLQVRLYDGAGQLRDVADDGVGNPVSGQYSSSGKIWRSMERNADPGDGSRADAWHVATQSIGFKIGLPEFGTARTENSNGAPVAVAGENQTGIIGQALSFDGSESSDPENQALTYSWDFGDGGTSTDATPLHTFLSAGEFTVLLTVSDGLLTAQATVMVNIAVAPIPTQNTPSSPTTAATPTTVNAPSCRGIQLTEIFPNPVGVDDREFFEVLNPTKTSIDLSGCTWWLNDKRKAVLKGVIVGAGQRQVVEKTVSKLSLTNTGGVLKLVDSYGTTLFSVAYPKAPDGESWSLLGKEWSWSNRVTPGKKNLAAVDDDVETTATKKEDEQPQSVGLSDIQTLDPGTLVIVRGIVTVQPNILGTRTLFLQSDSGAVSAVLPEDSQNVSVGDDVELIGKVRVSQGRKRIGVNSGGVRVVATGRNVQPLKITLDQLSPDLADVLVIVSGIISNSSGSKWLLDDGTAEAEVYVKSSTGIVKPRSANGDRLYASGIVSVTTAGIRLLPRTIEDLRIERVLGAATSQLLPAKNLPTSSPQQTLWYWVLVLIGGLAAAARPIWKFFQARKNPAAVEG